LFVVLVTLMTSVVPIGESPVKAESAGELGMAASATERGELASPRASRGSREPLDLPALNDSNVSKNNGKSRLMNGAIDMSAVRRVWAINLLTSASRCSDALVLEAWLSKVAPLYLPLKLYKQVWL
jgi:hypothetical protein